ncbi:hypothetical protein OXPF_03160 [Oxobacter pfennigii]|uniref:PucR C-terminal helix-turn-helix domain-containing protein n=1 Tax=Oxobacter pfennigii TaxID=36849 RepID=A0A0P8WU37_9CLOT|nr:helix-turn-helix domain-containing protein [Oxobacter pfennigii]KPU46206.1 hypothetical protein OXPF_03160 [Oxobacter pfennigii]
MKISMWMVANQLEGKDAEFNINESARRYKSVHFELKKDCLVLVQNGQDALLMGEGENNYIRIKNIDKEDALELIQNIFDKYSDWDEMLYRNMEVQNFQNIIDESWDIFRSPLVFVDSNNKLLAMSGQVDYDLNPEWKHLSEYGYLSVTNYNIFEDIVKKLEAEPVNKPLYCVNPPTGDRASVLMSLVRYNNVVYGRITVLEYWRKLTQGDIHLMQYMCNIMGRVLYRINREDKKIFINNNILKLIQGQTVSQDEIDQFLMYMNWKKNHKYRMCIIAFKKPNIPKNAMLLIQEYLNSNLHFTPSFGLEDHFVLLFNESKMFFKEIIPKIRSSYIFNLETIFGTSLQFDSLNKLTLYVKQAHFAIKYGYQKNPEARFFTFYKHALDYILSSKDNDEKYYACHPDVLEIWNSNPSANNDSLLTLGEYLACERSLLQASKNLFMHKNTLSYRVNKIIANMAYDIGDKYTREYILTSIRMLFFLSK